MKIKLCGVRTVADALLCAEAGADELGVIFAPGSRRRVTVAEAAAIRAALPAEVPLVGVFQGATADDVAATARAVGLAAAQLHNGWFHLDALPLYAAVQVADEAALGRLSALDSAARILLDGPSGGSGRSFAWSLGPLARTLHPAPLFIAGGLTPDNVAQAIAEAAPDGVDVASGIEGRDGFKDAGRVRAFVQAARQAQWTSSRKRTP